MDCIITVLNVSKQSAARAGVTGTAIVLDMPEKAQVRLSKSLLELSEANTLSIEGVLAFSLPRSKNNDAAFLEYLVPTVIDNRKDKYDCTVVVGSTTLDFTQIQVNGLRGRYFELKINRPKDHWADLASAFNLKKLDYSSFVMSKTAIVANWNFPAYEGDYHTPNLGQRPYYWPLIDYGGWCDQTEPDQGEVGRVKAVSVEDFRPWVSLPYVLQAGFCAIGWSLKGVVFDSDWCKRLWIYILAQDYYKAGKTGGRVVGRVEAEYNISFLFTFTELIQGQNPWTIKGTHPSTPLILRHYAGITNNTNVGLKYKFTVHGELHNKADYPYTVVFDVVEVSDDKSTTADLIFPTGEVLTKSTYTVDFLAGEKKEVYYSETVTLKPQQSAVVYVNIGNGFADDIWAQKGMWISVEPDNEALHTNDVPIISDCISDQYNLLECFKGFLHLIKGRVESDFITKTVTVYPSRRAVVGSDVLPGYFLEEEESIDIDAKIIEGSINSKPLRTELKRYVELGFKDPSDEYIKSLALTTPANGRKILNGLQYPDSKTEVKNPFFEATLEGEAYIASGSGGRHPAPILPRLWDNTEGKRSLNIAPRILYAFGEIRQINPVPISPVNALSSIFFDVIPNAANTGINETFGYATQVPTRKLSPTPTTYQGVFYGGGDGSIPDLFTMFYIGISQENRYGSILDALLVMNMNDYAKTNFRSLYKLWYNGQQLRVPMTDIRDFAPTEGKPTPCTFFVPPVETKCCDLPCGCQFTTCEYYMDMGVYMTQARLNEMQLSSFMVDGIEYVPTPIGFGQLKLVNNAGLRYVMNLIDTLNSVAAPYFTFGTSSKKDEDKGMRFFTIKRPSCIPFRIVIKWNGTDTYLYTQAEQKSKVFNSGAYGAFGYGTLYTTPTNCITTTEF